MRKAAPALALGCLALLLATAAASARSKPRAGKDRQIFFSIRPESAAPPKVTAFPDPDSAIRDRHTYSLEPIPRALTDDELAPDREALAYALRNALERKGFVSLFPDEDPDFLVRLEVHAEPTPHGVDEELPERRDRKFGHPQPLGGPVPDGRNQGSRYDLTGGFAGHSWDLRTVIHAEVQLLTAEGEERIWTAAGQVFAKVEQKELAAQMLVDHVMRGLPESRAGELDLGPGSAGLDFAVLAEDGEHYWPTVTVLAEGGAAAAAGLELYDRIVAIAGVSTVNVPAVEVVRQLHGEPGSALRLEVLRDGRPRAVEIVRR